jgi:hypothetical protein
VTRCLLVGRGAAAHLWRGQAHRAAGGGVGGHVGLDVRGRRVELAAGAGLAISADVDGGVSQSPAGHQHHGAEHHGDLSFGPHQYAPFVHRARRLRAASQSKSRKVAVGATG